MTLGPKVKGSGVRAIIQECLLHSIFIALLYLVTGRLGLLLAIPPGYATTVWPPSGIALGGVLIWGMRVLPGVFLGSFAVNLWITLSAAGSPDISAAIVLCSAIASGALLQAFVTGLLLRKYVGSALDLGSTKDVFKFFVLGGPVGCLVNASVSVTALFLSGSIAVTQIPLSWGTWWGGDTLGVITVTPIILTMFGKPRELWRKRAKLVALPLFGTFVLAVIAFYHSASSERSNAMADFQVESEMIVEDLNEGMRGYGQALKTLRVFFSTKGENVTLSEFRHFVQGILPIYAGMQGISWNPVIEGADREEFESRARREGVPDFQITELDGDGNLVRAGDRSKYIIVHYIEPPEANRSAVGYDISSDPVRKKAVDSALKTGEVVTTAPITLVQETDDKQGVLFVYPVFSASEEMNNSSRRSALGYFVAIIRIEDMITAILGNQLRSGKVAIRIADKDGRVLFTSGQVRRTEFVQTRTFGGIEGVDWGITMAPREVYLTRIRGLRPWLVLAGGLLFTSLLSVFLLVLAGRNEALSGEATERAQAQTALTTSEIRKAATLEASLDSIITIDGDGRIVDFNRSAEETFGHKRGDVIGQTLAEIIIPERYRTAHYDGMRRYMATGEGPVLGKRIEMSALRADGTEFPVELSIVAIKVEGDSLFTGVLRDITERKLFELQLKAAKEAAEAANSAKSAFLANMSHEIRTPLGAVLGFSELIGHVDVSASERANYLAVIKRNGELLSNVINDILDISKVEAGKLNVDRQDTSLSEILTDVATLLNLQATEKGIKLGISSGGAVPSMIHTDPLRLRQILLNVVGNAVKFTQRGTVEVKLNLQDGLDGSRRLEFVVTDTGPGISPEHAARLFEPFTQADVSTKRKFGGTGLGLVLAKRLSQLLGGDVVLTESTLGSGSTFTVSIDPGSVPVVLFESTAWQAQETARVAIPRAEISLEGVHVLVVEDSPDNRVLVARILRMVGATVDTAENGRDAIEKVHCNKYDALLMDLQMPIMDGYEATTELRRVGVVTPIIALTAHALRDEQQRCLRSGFTHHLPKPIDRHELVKVVAHYASKSGGVI